MQEQPRNRDWVKNAAIIFLVVILVLTFFSNTIMNRTLPEVATQEVTSGSIVARVRGTGTVQANSNTQVKMDQNRVIRSVLVKVGQQVKAGDVLFTLGEGASEDIDAAEDKLRSLQTSYNKIAATMPEFSYGAEHNKLAHLEEAYNEALTAEDAALKAAQQAASNKEQYETALKELESAIVIRDTEKATYEKELEAAKNAPEIRERDDKQKNIIKEVVGRNALDGDLLIGDYGDRDKLVIQISRIDDWLDELEKKEAAAKAEADAADAAATAAAQAAADAAAQAAAQAASEAAAAEAQRLADEAATAKAAQEQELADAQKAAADAMKEAAEAQKAAAEAQKAAADSANPDSANLGAANPNAANANAAADVAAAAEEQRLAEEAAAAEEQRLAEEAAAAEEKRLAEEAAAAEEKRLAEEAAAAEEKRLAEEAAAAATTKENSENTNVSENNGSPAENPLSFNSIKKGNSVILMSFQPSDNHYYTTFDYRTGTIPKSPRTGEIIYYNSYADWKGAPDKDRLTNWKAYLEDRLAEYDNIQREIYNLQDYLSPSRTAYDAAVLSVEKWKTAVEVLAASGNTPQSEAYKKAKENRVYAEEAYLAARQALRDKIAANENTITGYNIDLADLWQQITKTKEKLEDLLGGEEAQIKAKVSGTIQTLNAAPGDTKKKDDVLATIEVPDMGYMMSFSVTNDQASRLRVGDTGTVSNFYWGDEITATLKSIQIDQKNPATNKLLTFDLSGNVTAGSELTVSVGQKSANYDVIIPSSSVRTDANGTYVLKMESKNSPLGNRYLARRVPVEVLAVDDTNSAVSADLGYGDYVITSSSAPLKNGQMVRLATSS